MKGFYEDGLITLDFLEHYENTYKKAHQDVKDNEEKEAAKIK
jgi:hypothetical protein